MLLKKRTIGSLLLIELVIFFIGTECRPNQHLSATTVAVPQSVSRVVSLVPSVTEIVYALGAESSLVGNSNQCDYPEAAKNVPKVGDFVRPDLERIVALKPHLVFLTLPIHRPMAEKLMELGIAYMACNPQSVEEIFEEMESIAGVLGRIERGRALIDSLRNCLVNEGDIVDTLSVYVEISSAPLMSVGSRAYLSDLIRLAGGRNIFGDIDEEYFVVSPEDVASRNPDVILVLHPAVRPREVRRRLGWARIKAVILGRIHADLDEDLLLRPGPRLADGVLLLRRLLQSKGER